MTQPADSTHVASPRSSATLGDVLWLAVTGAVITALVHVGYTEFRFRVLNVFTWTNREFAWLSLAGYLTVFVVAAIPVAAVVLVLRKWVGGECDLPPPFSPLSLRSLSFSCTSESIRWRS